MSKQSMPTPKTSRPAGATAQSRASSATNTKSRMQPGRDRRRVAAQTASFEGRRDKKPVILNYGRDLLPAQKTRIQRRMYYIFAGVMIVAVLGILGFGWLSYNVIQPSQPIVTVNGVQIPQRDYRYMVAYFAQDTWNKLQAANVSLNDLNMQLNAEKDATKKKAIQDKINSAQVQISSYQSSFTQSQLDQQSIDWLIEDQLIQQNAAKYIKANPALKAQLDIPQKQVDDAYAAFGKNFPHGQSLANFLSKDNMSADNVKFAIAVTLRRTAMDQYQQSLVGTPQRQLHIERIEYDKLANAQADLVKLQQHPDQWAALAKADSLDSSSSGKGGDMGWVINGQQDQALEQWVFDPARKVGDMSGVIHDIDGTFDIIKVLEIDPSRAVDASTLTNLKSNALSHWLTGMRDLPPTKISATNQDMFNNSYNVPVAPNLNVTFPGQQQQTVPSGGIPGITP